MTEAQLSKAVLDHARLLGWRIARFPAANWVRTSAGKEFVKPLAHDTKGFPDALLVRERLIAVEFKAEKGKLSFEQLAWNEALDRAEVEVYLWAPRHWNDGTVERVLARTTVTA